MKYLSEELGRLDLASASLHALHTRDLLMAYKKKAFLCLPGKHPALPHAHSRFQVSPHLRDHLFCLQPSLYR